MLATHPLYKVPVICQNKYLHPTAVKNNAFWSIGCPTDIVFSNLWSMVNRMNNTYLRRQSSRKVIPAAKNVLCWVSSSHAPKIQRNASIKCNNDTDKGVGCRYFLSIRSDNLEFSLIFYLM